MSDIELTAIGNAIGMGYFAFVAMFAIWLRRVPEHESVQLHESAIWALLPAACWYLHRLFWNMALLTDTDTSPGPYALWALEWRHGATVGLFALAVYGGWRVLRPWMRPRVRRVAGATLLGSLVAHVVAWALLMRGLG